MKLDHVNIKASNDKLESTKNFYCAVLELSEGFRPSSQKNGYWLYSGDVALVHLSESNNSVFSTSENGLDHFAVTRTNLEKFVSHLAHLEIPASIRHNADNDVTQVFIIDPCGVKVEVCFYGEKPAD